MKMSRALFSLALLAVCCLPQNVFGATCNGFIIPDRQVRGLGYELGAVWAIHSELGVSNVIRLSKLDPTSGVALMTSPEFNYNGRGVCPALGSLWLTDALADVVRELDPVDFHQKSQFRTPGSEPCGITFDGTNLWLSDPWAGKIYKLTTSGEVLSRFDIPDVYRDGLAWDFTNGGLWTNTAEFELGHYTPDGVLDGSYVISCLPPGNRIYGVAFDGLDMFVSNLDGSGVFTVQPSAVPARPTSWGQIKAMFR